jgi:hypothetical protein
MNSIFKRKIHFLNKAILKIIIKWVILTFIFIDIFDNMLIFKKKYRTVTSDQLSNTFILKGN